MSKLPSSCPKAYLSQPMGQIRCTPDGILVWCGKYAEPKACKYCDVYAEILKQQLQPVQGRLC